MSEPYGVHTCHAECPCQTGGEPRPDFIEGTKPLIGAFENAYANASEEYRLWVNEERTVLVRYWSSGAVEVATRRSMSDTWGPPIPLFEEK